MERTSFARRGALVATLLAATLPLSAVGVAHAQTEPATTEVPAEAAAGWLTTQLGDDSILQTGFGPSVGGTIDAVLSFDAAGVASEVSADAAAAVAAQASSYASFPDEVDPEVTTWTPGPLGKLLLLANARPELDPTDLGSVDALAELQAIECTDGRPNCDADDLGAYKGLGTGAADSVSTFNQALAIIGLVASGVTPSDAAVTFLTAQACDDGGYGFTLRGDECTSAADTTGVVAQALLAVGDDAAQDAIGWLLANQDDSGGFVGFAGVDSSTTTYPVMALLAAGETDAATAGIGAIEALQAGCDAPDELMIGAIYYSEPDEEGQTAADDAFATAQATAALAGQHLLEISGEGSSTEIPTLACSAGTPTDEPADEPTEDPSDEPVEDIEEPVADGADDPTAGDDIAEEAGETLPETGTTSGLLVVLGLTLLLVGIGLVRRTRLHTTRA